MKGLFLPEITTEDFKDGCLESIEALIGEGEIYDIDYPEPCKDCISRQAYIERYRKWAYSEFGRKTDNEALAIRVAMSLPPVTPQPKTGRWIRVDKDKLKCSECEVVHFIAQYPQSAKINYCPNCGAKMESENKE